MSELILRYTDDQTSETLSLIPGCRHLIGSSRRCDLRVHGSGISRRHAELRVDDRGTHIRVLGSRAAMTINGEPARQAGPLASGDEITLGAVRLRLDPVMTDDRGVDSEASPDEHAGAEREPAASPELNPAACEPRQARISPSLVRRFQEAISKRLDLYRRDILQSLSTERLREEATATAWELIEAGELVLPAESEADRVVAAVVAETVGLGPIEALMDDPAVSEIMVNGHERIYVERNGQLQKTGLRFSSAGSLASVLDRIVSPLGRRLDEGSPLVDARLPDGSRVNAIIPPLALNGATVTIRRFSQQHIGLNELIGFGAMDEPMAKFLKLCIHRRRNLLISGGTGTGKTTVLNALSAHIGATERIVTIEDSAELQLQQDHVVALESRPANIEGSGAVPIRDLVRNALRMRPDRIIVGECRSGEALDMLQAMNTGHDGSLTTAHANSPRDALARLEVMTLMAGMELPARAIREQIASAIDIVVQLTRFGDGSRRITAITEVAGMEGEQILLNDLFVFDSRAGERQGHGGRHRATGQVPNFYEALRAEGVTVDLTPFQPVTGSC
ncbi:ATPase, T2SS/T4P/T4SS family [Spiribacter onubensis]|uniref:ATPase, T2SS/T4P/T4SS family n=1 Tax=Spiribacter onubensis TaxID=3122420 RepID=A0ABV3S889_9GAMM